MAVSSGRNHLQQMVHLREYFLVFHARFKENKNIVPITIPKLLAQEIEVSLSEHSADDDKRSADSSSNITVGGNSWQDIEKAILNGIRSQETHVLTQTCLQEFTANTTNNLNPQVCTL